ncbi:site-2 protease family protein [Patescibacteria group bacterium]|nr:site-2 protease family protein [Patescibacteria group bacterium]
MIERLFQDPIYFVITAVGIVIAISVHEFAHAAMAYYLGDPTAKNEGRLTLNPLSHLDLWGTLLLLLAGFGWGKPVPFNPYNLRNQRWGPALVSLAGPGSNLVMALMFIAFLKFVYPLLNLGAGNALFDFLYFLIIINMVLMTFNLLPVPPLDGSKLLFAILPTSMDNVKEFLQRYGFFILIGLVLFGGFFFSLMYSVLIGGVNLLLGL